MTMQWSPQQAAFLDWAVEGKGSVVLEAVAGAGKTTVLMEAGKLMPGQVAYMAYNRKIVDEAKAKLAAAGVDWKKMQANTAHGFGFAAYRKFRPNVRVDDKKTYAVIDRTLTGQPHPLAPWFAVIVQLVSLAKQSAYGIAGPADDYHAWTTMAEHFDVFDEDDGAPRKKVIEAAMDVLARSSEDYDVIDFDDMIYMPLLHRCKFWQFDVVMVDEAQDTNAARRALVRTMVRKGGRVVAVGDRHQAIYGFTGADADALDLIARDHSCSRMPLTVSYRCPQSVVAFARKWVSHIEAAPTAPEGEVSSTTLADFMRRNDLDSGAAVLSRTNKPLAQLAFRLIRQRTPCRVEGRDVAEGIKKLMTRWKVSSLDALETKLEVYLARETTKLLAAKKEAKLAYVEDAVETVRVVIDQCRLEGKHKVSDATDHVDAIFGDNVRDVLTLSSIHKAKGREWPRVFWLDRAGTCPNKWARQEWQLGQETNLCYVAATRAQQQLIEVTP
jgi:superfamily I DNA/RNA helicase